MRGAVAIISLALTGLALSSCILDLDALRGGDAGGGLDAAGLDAAGLDAATTPSDGSSRDTGRDPSVPEELCNGRDDDGDGVIDDGLRAFFLDIRTSTGCRDGLSATCNSQFLAECQSRKPRGVCEPTMAFGPVEVPAEGGGEFITIACVQATQSYVVTTAELQARHGVCNPVTNYAECNVAGYRECTSRLDPGSGSTGFAPSSATPSDDPSAQYDLGCLDRARVQAMELSLSSLTGVEPTCTGSARNGPECLRAAHAACTTGLIPPGDFPFATGFGPVEQGAGTQIVVCVRP